MTTDKDDLPPLPEEFGELPYQRPSGMWGRLEGYTAAQMRAYVLADRAQRVAPAEVVEEAKRLADEHATQHARHQRYFGLSLANARDAEQVEASCANSNAARAALHSFLTQHLGAQRVEQAEPVAADRAELAAECKRLADVASQAFWREGAGQIFDDAIAARNAAIDLLAATPPASAPAPETFIIEYATRDTIGATVVRNGYGAWPDWLQEYLFTERPEPPPECACFQGTCRGGDLVNGLTSSGTRCKAAMQAAQGPWCCEKGQALGTQVCSECQEASQAYSAAMDVHNTITDPAAIEAAFASDDERPHQGENGIPFAYPPL